MTMKISALEGKHEGAALERSIKEVLASSQLMAMATVDLKNNQPNCSNAYFCFDNDLTLYFISENRAEHCRLIEECPNVMCSIYKQWETWGENLQGVQLAGRCTKLSGLDALKGLNCYAGRFSAFKLIAAAIEAYRSGTSKASVFMVRPTHGKLLDEPRFGRRNYIGFQIKD